MIHISSQSFAERVIFEVAKNLLEQGKPATIINIASEVEASPDRVSDDLRDLYHNGFIDFDPTVPEGQWTITAVHEESTIY